MSAMRYVKEYWDDVEMVAKRVPGVSMLNGKTVMITGAGGLICSAVTDVLFYLNREQKANIRIVLAGRSAERIRKRFYCAEEGRDYEFVGFDATSGQAPSVAADYIIHGASNADPAAISRQPVETMLSNLLGLHALLEVARQTEAARLLYISSSEIYGKKSGDEPYEEKDYGYVDILNPRACYPSSKRAAETLCAAYMAEYGVNTVIVRPGHIYGPGITDNDSRASAQFTRDAIRGKDIVMKSAGTQLRSYCHSLDCASAILTVLLHGEAGTAYNISNVASLVTIRDVAETLARVTGVKVIFEDPSDAEKSSYNLMDNSALKATRLADLGWTALFDLSSGINQTVATIKKGKIDGRK